MQQDSLTSKQLDALLYDSTQVTASENIPMYDTKTPLTLKKRQII